MHFDLADETEGTGRRPSLSALIAASGLVENTCTADRGAVLTVENDHADHSLLLLEGWMALYKSLPDGRTQMIDIMLPGDFALVGTPLVPVAVCTVEALCDLRYARIDLGRIIASDSEARQVRQLVAANLLTGQARAYALLLRLGHGSAETRVAYALLELFLRLEALGATDGRTFPLPITQRHLGDYTGLTNVHVCRTMRRFEHQGLVAHPDQGHVTLLGMDALCDKAGIALEDLRNQILIRRAG